MRMDGAQCCTSRVFVSLVSVTETLQAYAAYTYELSVRQGKKDIQSGLSHLTRWLFFQSLQEPLPVIVIRRSDCTPIPDAQFYRLVLFQQIDSNLSEQRHVFWAMILSDTAIVFTKADIQYPVERFYLPV